jgi:hypothetical protein
MIGISFIMLLELVRINTIGEKERSILINTFPHFCLGNSEPNEYYFQAILYFKVESKGVICQFCVVLHKSSLLDQAWSHNDPKDQEKWRIAIKKEFNDMDSKKVWETIKKEDIPKRPKKEEDYQVQIYLSN